MGDKITVLKEFMFKNSMGYMEQNPTMPDNYTPNLWNQTTSNDFKPAQPQQVNKTMYSANGYNNSQPWNGGHDWKPRENATAAVNSNNNAYNWGNPQNTSQYNPAQVKNSTQGLFDSQNNSNSTKGGEEDEESEEELVDQVIETSNGNTFNLSSQQNNTMKYDINKVKTENPADGGKAIKTEANFDSDLDLNNSSNTDKTPDANYWTQFMVEYDRALTDSSSKPAANGMPQQHNGGMYGHSQQGIDNSALKSTFGQAAANVSAPLIPKTEPTTTNNASLYSMFDYSSMENGSEAKKQKMENDQVTKPYSGNMNNTQDNATNSLYQMYSNYNAPKDINDKTNFTQRPNENENKPS